MDSSTLPMLSLVNCAFTSKYKYISFIKPRFCLAQNLSITKKYFPTGLHSVSCGLVREDSPLLAVSILQTTSFIWPHDRKDLK